MIVLVINSGSSSLKYQVRDVGPLGAVGAAGREDEVISQGIVERIGEGGVADHAEALEIIEARIAEDLDGRAVDAVGHRVVHGGELFGEPVLIDDHVLRAVEELAPLAPLHNPPAALGIRAIMAKWPELPQAAVFDTAFHRTLPEHAWRYALPDSLYTEHGIRRYGFHGTSHQYVTARAAQFLGTNLADFNAVVAHLGNGASVTAIRGGLSVDTSMGYTPLEGLVMGTRSGDVDPSILVALQRQGYSADELDTLLNRESGLKGLAGSNDMRAVVDAAAAGERAAALALDVASYRLAKYIGAYHVAVGGAEAVVFTAGIGENSAAFRQRVVDRLGALGITLDAAANQVRGAGPRRISTPGSAISVLVVPTDEEHAIAEATMAVVRARPAV